MDSINVVLAGVFDCIRSTYYYIRIVLCSVGSNISLNHIHLLLHWDTIIVVLSVVFNCIMSTYDYIGIISV